MRTLKHRIQGFSKKVRNLFQPYLSEDIVDVYQPGLDKLIRVLQDGGDHMANEMRMAKGQGEMEVNENGVKRESNKGRGAFYLFPYEALEELAKWYEAGAEKYGERNWEKGISVKDCMNRMARHSAKACNGWMDEGPFAHLVAVIWNAMAAITGIKRNPYKNDFFRDEYLKELGLPDNEYSKDYKSSDELFGHLLTDENAFEYSKDSDLAEIDRAELDPNGGVKFHLVFKDQKKLDRFKKEVAKYGIVSVSYDTLIREDKTQEKS